VLIVEVAATRIISPYYGNTIYTVSSVIGVTLGALSLGYYRGGKEGAKVQHVEQFYQIIQHAGEALLLLFFIQVMVLPYGGYFFSLRSGPVIWSLFMFFLPSYFMGKLSPVAIALATKNGNEVSLKIGSLFFWSTFGSIVGAIGTGFILLPHAGIRNILFILTLSILLLGSLGRTKHAKGRDKGRRLIDLAFLVVIASIIYGFSHYDRASEVRFVRDGVYEQLSVTEREMNGKPVRLFVQDKTTSSGMYLGDDSLSVFPYTDFYRLHRLTNAQPERALFIGAGAYTMPKLLQRELPDTVIDVVDIEPGIERIAAEWFRLPERANIRTHIADGRRFLFESTTTYDLIFSDVYYTMNSVPAHMATKEFFAEAKRKLAPRGIFLANVIGSSMEFPGSMLYGEIRTMRSVFPHVLVFPVESSTSTMMQNFILAGSDVPIERTDGEYRTLDPSAKSGVRTYPLHVSVEHADLSNYPILTDDFAPTEYMAAQLMRRFYDREFN
jgi:spermidine synthase